MKLKLIIFVLLSLSASNLLAQKKEDASIQNYLGFEIYAGMDVVKLSSEGLFCSTYKNKWRVRAFTQLELEQTKVFELQNFILNSKYFIVDTVVDNSKIKVYDSFPLEIVIKSGYMNNSIMRFVDNENMCDDTIDSLISLANQIIPNNFRKLYSIKRNMKCGKAKR
jgi:hypothetical protein